MRHCIIPSLASLSIVSFDSLDIFIICYLNSLSAKLISMSSHWEFLLPAVSLCISHKSLLEIRRFR
jgi:hypothetical protein